MAETPTRVIRGYVDFVSPFSWLAVAQLPDVERRAAEAGHPIRFELIPMLLPAVLDARGLVAAGEVKEKRDHELRRIDWRAQELGLSCVPPQKHPFVSLRSLRAAARFQGTGSMFAAVRALFAAGWERGLDLTKFEVVEGALAQAGLDTDGLEDWIQSDECKALIRSNTEEALAAGMFGVPSFVTPDDRLFWGQDQLPWIERWAGGELPQERASVLEAIDRPLAPGRRRAP